MKIESLKEYIRQEVKKAVKEELKEYLFESLVQKKVDSASTITEQSNDVKNNVEPEPPKPKKFVKYTKNDALNQILNETAGGIPKEGSYVGLIGGDFGNKPSESINEVTAPSNAPEPVKTVVNAMNRDYRSLLKAVDKKRSGKL